MPVALRTRVENRDLASLGMCAVKIQIPSDSAVSGWGGVSPPARTSIENRGGGLVLLEYLGEGSFFLE